MHGMYINISVLVYFIDGLFSDAVSILENKRLKRLFINVNLKSENKREIG